MRFQYTPRQGGLSVAENSEHACLGTILLANMILEIPDDHGIHVPTPPRYTPFSTLFPTYQELRKLVLFVLLVLLRTSTYVLGVPRVSLSNDHSLIRCGSVHT